MSAAVEEARRWLGTPYHNQASVRGVGCDCLGLVRGVFRAVRGAEPEAVPPYTPGWDEVDTQDQLIAACHRHLTLLPAWEFPVGAVVLFRMKPWAVAKHCGIVSAVGKVKVPHSDKIRTEHWMIHAYRGHGCIEVPMGLTWKRRAAAAFAF